MRNVAQHTEHRVLSERPSVTWPWIVVLALGVCISIVLSVLSGAFFPGGLVTLLLGVPGMALLMALKLRGDK